MILNNIKLSYIISESTNPYENIALEEYLLFHTLENECILYLWQNENTVVIGRNQNAWKECKVEELSQNGGCLARRLSGGGAVFHDLGNLNFTFLVRKDLYDVEKQTEVILQAVHHFGILAKRTGRNDILIEGQKFSGNAFHKSKDYYYHHGTILINGNTQLMGKYLTPSAKKMQSKSVSSVRSRVCNLCDHNQNITVQKMKEALIRAFGEVYKNNVTPFDLGRLDKDWLYKEGQKFRSWEWLFGIKIEFTTKWNYRFDWGEIEIDFLISQGVIQDIVVWSDALDIEVIASIENSLHHVKFIKEEMKIALGELGYIMEVDWDV